MSLIRTAAELRANPAENPERRLTGGLLVSILERFGVSSSTGKNIGPENAVRLSAVYRAVSLIAGLLGSLPLKTFVEDTHETRTVPIIEDPSPGMTKFEFRETMAGHLGLWGNFDAFKVKTDGVTTALLPYHPKRVDYDREAPSEENPSGRLYLVKDNTGRSVARLTDNEVFHIPLFSVDGFVGMSPIRLMREAIAGGLAAEEYANKLWKGGMLASGIVTTDARLDDEKAKSLKRRWSERIQGLDNAYEIAVMDRGAKFQPISMPPIEAQFLESRKFAIDEIARMYGLPPHLLSHQEKQTSWGTGIEQHNIGFVIYTLNPVWMTRIEQRLTLLIREDPEFARLKIKAEHQVQGLMRGDSSARSLFYDRMLKRGVMTVNEIRSLENLPPIEGGDEINVSNEPAEGEFNLESLTTIIRQIVEDAA